VPILLPPSLCVLLRSNVGMTCGLERSENPSAFMPLL
jgi:hypothetical protein